MNDLYSLRMTITLIKRQNYRKIDDIKQHNNLNIENCIDEFYIYVDFIDGLIKKNSNKII
jgi:hypothetical protein